MLTDAFAEKEAKEQQIMVTPFISNLIVRALSFEALDE
jgi:hypothetical protein